MTEAEVRLRRDAATDWRDSTRIKVTAGDLRAVLATLDAARAEATAAAEQRFRDVERLVAACERADIAGELPDELAAALAVLHGLDPSPGSKTASHIRDLDAPPPASPRQGEPVEVEEQRNEARIELQRLRRLIVSYADLTHRVVQEGGDWREITAEWSIVVAEARAALSEPAEP